jgi:EAL domain-containing protein (putative c-di-GMP-specific phosphodiesterase class I)
VFTDDAELLRTTLAALSALGCVISLDDFGRGASSLTQLAGLPVDVLKMDRAFVTGIDTDPRTAALVATVADLGRTLGMDVVAEGVETPAQLAALSALGCGFLQGWLLGRPVPADVVPAVVDDFDPAVLDTPIEGVSHAPIEGVSHAPIGGVSHATASDVHFVGRLG